MSGKNGASVNPGSTGMSATREEVRDLARLDSAGSHAGIIKAHYPYWDSYFRPSLVEAVDLLPAQHFDYKPRPEMLTARQQILHIAEAERWWVSHIVDGEEFRDYTLEAEDKAQGWVTVYDAPDHNALRFTLEEAHRHTQRWFGFPVAELDRVITHLRPDGTERRFTLHWILDHVQEHELHHRAQLCMYLRMLGIAPPQV
jgi:uncharacterized damage-inducible protein DinB